MISLSQALALAVGPANVAAAGHAVADWFDVHNCCGAAHMIRDQLQDQPAGDAVPHNRPDTSLRSELMAKLATQREVILDLCKRVDRLEMRADGLTPIERVQRRWAKEASGGDKLDRQADEPAVQSREPASVVEEPSDAELLELMPEQFRTDLATVSLLAARDAGTGVTPGLFRVSLNTGALEYARAVWDRARQGHQPAPPANKNTPQVLNPRR